MHACGKNSEIEKMSLSLFPEATGCQFLVYLSRNVGCICNYVCVWVCGYNLSHPPIPIFLIQLGARTVVLLFVILQIRFEDHFLSVRREPSNYF